MEQEEYDFNMPWTAGGKDVISQEMEMAKTNSELKIKEVPPGVAAKHKSVKNDYKSQPITSWFQKNKHSPLSTLHTQKSQRGLLFVKSLKQRRVHPRDTKKQKI